MSTNPRNRMGSSQASVSFRSHTDDVTDTVMMEDQSTTLLDEQGQERDYHPHDGGGDYDGDYTYTDGDYDPAEQLNQPIPCENIRVEAPSDLPGGYQMETEIGGRPLLVTVPKGGVLEGEVFTPVAASLLSDIQLSQRGVHPDKADVPSGHWRDGFWNICAHGPFHCSLWNSLLCPLLAAAQVITRLQLTWYGTPASNVAQVSVAFQVLVMIMAAYCCIRALLFLVYAYLDPNADPKQLIYIEPPPSYFFFTALDDLLFYMYVAFLVVVLRNIRSHMRARFSIANSENVCCPNPGCEDVCCSLVCPCFTVSQMLRHTTDYQVNRSICCSATGLVKDAPAIV